MGTFTFTQLGGAKKVLKLADASAPHGRPRKDAVVRDGLELREAEVYYPGNDTAPTRHVFGTRLDPWNLKGYFRDRYLGKGGAKAKTEEVKAFVKDAQLVRATWDDVVSVVGLIKSFDPGRESDGEVEWKLTLKVDSDDYADTPLFGPVPPLLGDYLASILAYLQIINAARDLGGLKISIFDLLSTLIGLIGDLIASLQSIADGVASFEKATIGQLNRISSLVSSLTTVSLTLREAFASVGPDVALVRQRADTNAELFRSQTTVEDAIRRMLATTSDLDRAAKAAALGKIRTTYIVTSGDTWESISIRFYNSPDRAPDLQLANDGVSLRAGIEVRIPV